VGTVGTVGTVRTVRTVRTVGTVGTVGTERTGLRQFGTGGPGLPLYSVNMMPYERLTAWEKCHELTLAVYRTTREWPREETYGLTSQARRAAYSAAANMAEGAARQGAREFRRFLDMSVGSLNELSYVFRLAKDLGLSSEADLQPIEELRQTAGRMTWRLYESIRKKAGRTAGTGRQ
jgi:four helix bundle protein